MAVTTVNPQVVHILEGLGFEPNDAGTMEETPGILEQGFDYFTPHKSVSAYVETATATGQTQIYLVVSEGGAVSLAKYILATTHVDLLVAVDLLKEAIH